MCALCSSRCGKQGSSSLLGFGGARVWSIDTQEGVCRVCVAPAGRLHAATRSDAHGTRFLFCPAFLQVQKLKVDTASAMLEMDQILKCACTASVPGCTACQLRVPRRLRSAPRYAPRPSPLMLPHLRRANELSISLVAAIPAFLVAGATLYYVIRYTPAFDPGLRRLGPCTMHSSTAQPFQPCGQPAPPPPPLPRHFPPARVCCAGG